MADDTEAVLDLERRRCAAIAAGDAEALRALLAPGYLHVHMTGKLDDAEGHVRSIVGAPRRPERGPLLVRFYGDLALITGEQTNHSGERATRAYCHQVAAKTAEGWRFISVQLTPMAS